MIYNHGYQSEAHIKRLLLIHWDAPEAEARVARLEAMGYDASFQNRTGPALLREIKANPPSAVLIDLSRLPAQGRDVGVVLRLNGATRLIPIIFVDGLPEKVLLVRQTLPDAVYSTWTHLADDLDRAFGQPARQLVVPDAAPAASSGKSAAGKLGIQAGNIVALLGAPPRFAEMLEPLPKGVSFRSQMSDECHLNLWFVRSWRELQEGIVLRVSRLSAGRLWILVPKKSNGQSGSLDQARVRELGLTHGLVTDKVASIDDDWSGVLFERRQTA